MIHAVRIKDWFMALRRFCHLKEAGVTEIGEKEIIYHIQKTTFATLSYRHEAVFPDTV
jgi:hypothetical protein